MKNKGRLLLGIILITVGSVSASSPGRDDASASLTEGIRKAILSSVRYGVFDIVFFETEGADVTLLGSVRMPYSKQDIGERVAKVPGIGVLTNNIEVLPVSGMDDQIRRRVYRKLFLAADMHRYLMSPVPDIHIIVKRGHVTLEGVVGSDSDKQLALIITRGMPGIFSLTNNLIIGQ
jgi:osmotically-inducible protein OsmY